MSRNLIILIGVIVIGAAAVMALVLGYKVPTLTNQQTDSQPTTMPDSQITPPQTGQQSREEIIDKLRQKLFEQGFSASAKVEQVYPGLGFTLVDERGDKVFVHWTQEAPVIDQAVTVKGLAKKLTTEELDNFKKDPGFTPEVEQLLNEKNVYIEAQEVNPA